MARMATDDEEEVEDYPDWLMIAASQEYKRSQVSVDDPPHVEDSRFGPVVSEGELTEAVSDSVPMKTCAQTKWCVDT